MAVNLTDMLVESVPWALLILLYVKLPSELRRTPDYFI